MGNQRFRLSDMMPNAWFYKLKDMGKNRNRNTSQSSKKKPSSSAPTTTHKRPYVSQPHMINPKATDTHFPAADPPRKSSKKKTNKRKSIYKPSPAPILVSSSVSAGCSCRATFNTVWTNKPDDAIHHQSEYCFASSSTEITTSPEPEFHECLNIPEFESKTFVASDESNDRLASWLGSCSCRVRPSTTDIIIDMTENLFPRKIDNKVDYFDVISELELPPILTKPPAKFNNSTTTEAANLRRSKLDEKKANHESLSIKTVKETRVKAHQKELKPSNPPPLARKSTSSTSTGVRLRTNSPRMASKKIQSGHGRKSISSTTTTTTTTTTSKTSRNNKRFAESFAIVKSSIDPQTDFKDSMMEMIIENNIKASKDLEELLACYLLLNSNEYHDLIVKAFEQIWFDTTKSRS